MTTPELKDQRHRLPTLQRKVRMGDDVKRNTVDTVSISTSGQSTASSALVSVATLPLAIDDLSGWG